MKKLAFLVCVLMMFSIVACTDEPDEIEQDTDDVTEEVEDEVEDGAQNGNVDQSDDGNLNADNENDVVDDALTGSAQGYGGEVTVKVVVDGDDIVSVEAEGPDETEGVGTNALEQLPDKIEEADSTDVDAIAGATVTSNAIKEAVDNALGNKE